MLIRRVTPHDFAHMIELRRLMLEYMSGSTLPAHDLRVMEDFFRRWDYKDPLCLVAEVDGKVAGCIAVSFYQAFPGPKNPSGLFAYLYNFAVYDEYRNRGIGRALFASILKECKDKGVGRISLYATDMGRPIYESYGFSHEIIAFPEMRLYYKDLSELEL